MKTLLIRYHDRDNINSREIKNIVHNVAIWPPLGLLYLATLLKKHGYEVRILDVVERKLDSAGARKAILDSGADIVGITATTPEVRGVMEAARFAKESGARVVVGGPHIGIFPDETLSFREADFAVQGDGEIPLLRLVEALGSSNPDFSTVPGLVYKKDGKIYKNGVYIEHDLDKVPFPDWNLINIRAYRRVDVMKPLATVISGRGCSYKCGFCYRGADGIKTRFRDPISVVDEMEYLAKNWGIREIVFCNDTLTMRQSHITAMCEELLRRNLKVTWQGATRVDAVNPEMLKLMKKSGCTQLKFGVESGSGEILKLMQKGITKEQARDAFGWCRKERIKIGAYFIIGYAGENSRTIQETIDFAKELDPDFVMFYAGVPLPDSSFHELAVKTKKIDPNYWRDYVMGRRNDKIPYLITDMNKWIQRAFRQFYGRPSFLAKKILSPEMWLSVIKRPRLILGLFFPKDYE